MSIFLSNNKLIIIIIVIGLLYITTSWSARKPINYDVSSDISDVQSEQTENSTIFVQVTGAVNEPGLYEMQSGDRINDLLASAGAEEYNSECINLAQKLVDEQNLYIPSKDEECKDDAAVSDNGVVNINTASSYELQTLSGIGEAKAMAIVEYRTENGTFESKEQLLQVEGISEGLLQSIEDSISLS